MENITTLILGILMIVLPAGEPGEAGKRISNELRLDRAGVVVKKQHEDNGRMHWDTLRVVLRPWETDTGTAGKAEWEFTGVEAVREGGDWKLQSVEGATVTLSFDEDELWETVAITQTTVSVTGVWIEEDAISLKGAWSSMMAGGIPIEFEVSGVPEMGEGGVVMLGGTGTTRVFRFNPGEWVREKILDVVNPLMYPEEFDIMSAFSAPYEKYVGEEIHFQAEGVKLDKGELIVNCVLNRMPSADGNESIE